jgi:hypothetical protein
LGESVLLTKVAPNAIAPGVQHFVAQRFNVEEGARKSPPHRGGANGGIVIKKCVHAIALFPNP